MSENSVTRTELSDAVVREVGLSKFESMQLVDDVLTCITEALVDGGTVKISSFGTFKVISKSERIGRNPKTKVSAKISARKVISFKPSLLIKKKLNFNGK